MASNGKLEGAIHIPAAGWTFSLTDGSVTGQTVTIPGDGYRFLSNSGDLTDGLLLEMEQQMESYGDSYTFALSDTTGKVTVSNTNAFSITWTSTDLRDVLGFTGNLSSATSHESDDQCRALWLPDRPSTRRNSGSWAGDHVADYSTSTAPDGSLYALMGPRRTELTLVWQGVTRAKVWTDNESTTNESFERFLLDCIWGEAGFGEPGGPVNFHPDETDDNSFNGYRVAEMLDTRDIFQQVSQDYVGVWSVTIPRLVKLPS